MSIHYGAKELVSVKPTSNPLLKEVCSDYLPKATLKAVSDMVKSDTTDLIKTMSLIK